MKNLSLICVLICFTGLHAKLVQNDIAQILSVPEVLAQRLIDRITYIDSLNTHHALYYPILTQAFINERGYKIGCEIGIFTGGHAAFILANSSVERLYCVDSYIAPMESATIITDGFEKSYWKACWDTIYYYAIDRLSIFGNRTQFFRYSAEKAATMIDEYSLDFVFIDGDHSYNGALSDCKNYYDKVRSGGIIAGDDYDIEGVGQAVRDFFTQKNLVINIYPGQKRFWWVEKP